MEKQCKACGETKLLTEFFNAKDGRLGRGARCKICLGSGGKKGDYNRKTHAEVSAEFADAGCVLLSDEYKNNSTKLRYICVCGNEAEIAYASFRVGQRCVKCKAKRASERMRKYTIEDVREIFESRGSILLSNEYKSTKTKLDYICHCGSPHSINLNGFLYQGSNCAECKRRVLSGDNHYLWDPNRSDEERQKKRSNASYQQWRKSVFERDGYVCQCCRDRSHRDLTAHHMNSYHWCVEGREDTDNGITLCVSCHKDFHSIYGYRHNTKDQFSEYLYATKYNSRGA